MQGIYTYATDATEFPSPANTFADVQMFGRRLAIALITATLPRQHPFHCIARKPSVIVWNDYLELPSANHLAQRNSQTPGNQREGRSPSASLFS